jgi:hypothetical protein
MANTTMMAVGTMAAVIAGSLAIAGLAAADRTRLQALGNDA